MASLEERNGSYRVVFRYAGQKYSRSLKTSSERAAHGSLARLEDNLRRLELGTLVVPDDADIASYLLSDGQVNGKPNRKRTAIRTLKQLCDRFFESIPSGSLEESTLTGMRVHVRYLKRLLDNLLLLREFKLEDLQDYVDARSKEKGIRGNNISPATIKKELTTLRLMWNWARNGDYLARPMTQKGLRYPKVAEKPPFQTWADIERKVARGGLSESAEAELWDCLFLTLVDIDELLQHVQSAARYPFIYPMFVFAAHTGARRSEMIRSLLDDIDMAGESVIIREKKRVRGKTHHSVGTNVTVAETGSQAMACRTSGRAAHVLLAA